MTAVAMAADAFWQIIEGATRSAADPDAQAGALRAILRERSLEDLIAFEVAFRRHLNQAYRWDLCGVACIVNGSVSNDGFEYFLRWLVLQGREVYEAALANPDSLTRFKLGPGPGGWREFEEIYYVAHRVFKEKGAPATSWTIPNLKPGLHVCRTASLSRRATRRWRCAILCSGSASGAAVRLETL
jgi:hypothetical protein